MTHQEKMALFAKAAEAAIMVLAEVMEGDEENIHIRIESTDTGEGFDDWTMIGSPD